MGIFYFDQMLFCYEELYQWDQALNYLERLYFEGKDRHMLYSLIGFSWFYLIEGPVVSKKYGDDQNTMALSIWKKYIDIGVLEAYEDSFFCFIAGYSLSLHGDYISEDYEKMGHQFINSCAGWADDVFIQQLAENFLMNEHSDKYIPINSGKTICEQLFNGDSLLDRYFNEIYGSKGEIGK